MPTLTSFFSSKKRSIKIFENLDAPTQPFRITATQVRAGKAPTCYLLEDPEKWPALVDKWRFEPGGPISRCGYDYQIVITNGDTQTTIDVCFLCNTLVFNHQQTYQISKSHIMDLLEEDFSLQP